MAADYSASHSSVSLVSPLTLLNSHQEDRARGLSELQIQQIKVYFVQQIWELSRVCKLRYRVAATAAVYFRKFYVRNSFGGSSHDPRLVHVGCLYLASKTEETLLQAKHLIVYVRRVQPSWPYEVKHLLDSEMVIIQDLDFMLVVYHPYRPLMQYKEAGVPRLITQHAWAALNDLYRCDAPLMYPPHVLALGCLLYAWAATQHQPAGTEHAEGSSTPAGVMVPGGSSTPVVPSAGSETAWDCMDWLKDLNVNLEQVIEVTEHLMQLYHDLDKQISADECKRLLDVSGLKSNSAQG